MTTRFTTGYCWRIQLYDDQATRVVVTRRPLLRIRADHYCFPDPDCDFFLQKGAEIKSIRFGTCAVQEEVSHGQ